MAQSQEKAAKFSLFVKFQSANRLMNKSIGNGCVRRFAKLHSRSRDKRINRHQMTI